MYTYTTYTGIRATDEELDAYVNDMGISFELKELAYWDSRLTSHDLDPIRRRIRVKRRYETLQMLSLLAPDQGRVNQDAECLG